MVKWQHQFPVISYIYVIPIGVTNKAIHTVIFKNNLDKIINSKNVQVTNKKAGKIKQKKKEGK